MKLTGVNDACSEVKRLLVVGLEFLCSSELPLGDVEVIPGKCFSDPG